MKQQDLLVEAWANSDLWKVYNLVLVSGNLEEPNDTEKKMLSRIENLIGHYPHISGRLCFTGTMSNAEVRLLEHFIIQQAECTHPPVYVCSSVKEEFGIALLEAMSAGFLLFLKALRTEKHSVHEATMSENAGLIMRCNIYRISSKNGFPTTLQPSGCKSASSDKYVSFVHEGGLAKRNIANIAIATGPFETLVADL